MLGRYVNCVGTHFHTFQITDAVEKSFPLKGKFSTANYGFKRILEILFAFFSFHFFPPFAVVVVAVVAFVNDIRLIHLSHNTLIS